MRQAHIRVGFAFRSVGVGTSRRVAERVADAPRKLKGTSEVLVCGDGVLEVVGGDIIHSYVQP